MPIKTKLALAGIFMLPLLVIGTSVTPASAQRCGQAPNCNGLRGARWDMCQARRAEAEADCQRRGVGYESGRHRVRGAGPKYRKCKNFARQLRNDAQFDEATSMRDCD